MSDIKIPHKKNEKLAVLAALELGLLEPTSFSPPEKPSTILDFRKANGETGKIEIWWEVFKSEPTVEEIKVEIKRLIATEIG